MTAAGGTMEALFKGFIAQDGLEKSIYHLCHDPRLPNFAQGVHALSHTLLGFGDHLRVVGTHLIDMHYQGREETIDTL
jgi:hypothetical protein